MSTAKYILPNTIFAIIIRKVSEEDPTFHTLIKLSLVCKMWAFQLVPYHFKYLKHSRFDFMLRLATQPIIPKGRECRFTDIQLLRPSKPSISSSLHFSQSKPTTPQLTNGKLLKFLQSCTTLRSLSLYNYSLDNEVNFGSSLCEILKNNDIKLSKLELMNLDLVSNGSSIIISSLKTNCNLTELNLSRNFLREKDGILIGDALKHNKTLTKLDLSFNEFRLSGLKAIMEGLQYNTGITDINLEAVCRLDCMITGFNLSSPPLTPSTNSQVSQLVHSNSFQNSPGSNQYLTVNNNYSNININHSNSNIPSNLSNSNNNIVHNHHNNNTITPSVTTTTTTTNPISHSFNLNLLSITNNSPGNFINSSMGTPPLFMSMINGINDNIYSSSWVPSSPSSISMNTKLIDAIRNLRFNNTIKSINLSHNTFGKPFNLSLGELIQDNNSLKSLQLNYLKLDDESGSRIASSLRTNGSLKSISMIFNQLGKDTGFELANSLSFNRNITHLYLSNNLFSEEVGNEFGTMLKVNSTLLVLDLSDNNIGSNGCKSIFESLKSSNNTLKKLYLRNNKISDNSGPYISSLIKENKSLVTLDLSNNCLQTNSGMLISIALESNSSLKHLNLSNNGLLEPSSNSEANIKRCIQCISNLFLRNKSIEALELDGNYLLDSTNKDIQSLVQRNQSISYQQSSSSSGSGNHHRQHTRSNSKNETSSIGNISLGSNTISNNISIGSKEKKNKIKSSFLNILNK
ncbi:hypothetical protein CYY_000872 [Polysphondylium violaceum]|uniref:Leucine-rich repeat-containing protein n=1 Tax=Polysphondylium violaceum TaxID=133409 RepID=A0A8J4Q2Z8_9MYCE|nr:hypothetical protein CYY_000872 [Polysphondylium violaceum]